MRRDIRFDQYQLDRALYKSQRASVNTASLQANNGSGQAIPSGAPGASNTIQNWTSRFDTSGGAFNAVSGIFTAATSGVYLVATALLFNTAAVALNSAFFSLVCKNGGGLVNAVYSGQYNIQTAGVPNLQTGCSGLVQLSVGDTVRVVIFHNAGVSVNLNAGSTSNYLSIGQVG